MITRFPHLLTNGLGAGDDLCKIGSGGWPGHARRSRTPGLL